MSSGLVDIDRGEPRRMPPRRVGTMSHLEVLDVDGQQYAITRMTEYEGPLQRVTREYFMASGRRFETPEDLKQYIREFRDRWE